MKKIYGLATAMVLAMSFPAMAATRTVGQGAAQAHGEQVKKAVVGNDILDKLAPGGEWPKFKIGEYNPETNMIPMHGKTEMDTSSYAKRLFFMRTDGTVAIDVHENWSLIRDFYQGRALVKDLSTNEYVFIDTSGNELGRIRLPELPDEIDLTDFRKNIILLPESSEYDMAYSLGASVSSQPDNFHITFVKMNGEQKVVKLPSQYWTTEGRSLMESVTEAGDISLKVKTGETGSWFSIGDGTTYTDPSYLVSHDFEVQGYLDKNGNLKTGSLKNVPKQKIVEYNGNQSYGSSAWGQGSLQDTDNYKFDTIKPSGGGPSVYELMDRNGNALGVAFKNVYLQGDSFVLGEICDKIPTTDDELIEGSLNVYTNVTFVYITDL